MRRARARSRTTRSSTSSASSAIISRIGAAPARRFRRSSRPCRRSRRARASPASSSASGSAGTLAAGDYLKEKHGAKIAVVEAVECPTLLHNGYGEHNIQGIGDKHVPLIHNVMNTDLVIGISDQATDGAQRRLQHRGRAGLPCAPPRPAGDNRSRASSTSASRGSPTSWPPSRWPSISPRPRRRHRHRRDRRRRACTRSELRRYLKRRHNFRRASTGELAAELVGRHLSGADTEHVLDATQRERERIFNLGYFTWVEQQGVSLADFDSAARSQDFWRGCTTSYRNGTR